MFSWGDWTWADDVHFQLYDEAQNPIGKEESAYIKNVHVGNSAQMTASLGATWEMVKGQVRILQILTLKIGQILKILELTHGNFLIITPLILD